MHSSSQEQDPTIKVPMVPASTHPITEKDNISKISFQNTSPSSNEDSFKLYELDTYSCSEDSQDYFLKMKLRKSQSLVDVIEKERHSSCHDIVEDDSFDKGYTSEYDHERSLKSFRSINDADICKESRMELYNNHNKNMDEAFDSFAGAVHHDPLFSIAILEQFDGEQHDHLDDLSVDHDCLGQLSSETKPILERPHSLGDLRVKNTNPNGVLISRPRSSENIFFIDSERTEVLGDDEDTTYSKFSIKQDAFNLLNTANGSVLDEKNSLFNDGHNELLNKKDNGEDLMNKSECDNPSVDGNGSFPYANSEETCFAPDSNDRFSGMGNEVRDDKYWYGETQCVDPSVGRDGCLYSSSDVEINQMQSEMDGMGTEQYLQHTSSVSSWNELGPEEFHIRRIKDWISQINIQDKNIVEEQVESLKSVASGDPHQGADLTTKKHETRNGHGMEVAYNYISTLNPASPLAQMANLGLVTIPVLSAFVSLRVLNLSGNAIVRITSGVLPRGLHMLKLSKNNISTIEGLRELTRLRVLDLSHNRITRIGHGLASCSSLKELYLAGNKISEVEGLHRLLKLNILDLRNNKISTTKGLRQLAANYSSLQAISLDGNPAQLNVGDPQLKKHLLTLLPHLVYYNKQSIRTSRSKEVSERSARSLSSHKFESGLKSDHRLPRKGTHGTGLHRSASSSHVRSTNAAISFSKPSKSKHTHSSSVGLKPSDHISGISKLLRLQPSNPLRRIQSEGEL